MSNYVLASLNSHRNQVGEVLQFKYDHGSNPGSTRTVLVLGYLGVNNGTLQGHDFDRGDLRNFSAHYIRDVRKVQGVQVLDTAVLPSNVDDIVDGFASDGKQAVHDTARHRVVVFDKTKLDKYATQLVGSTLSVTGPQGTVRLTIFNGVVSIASPAGSYQRPSGEQIVKAFQSIG